ADGAVIAAALGDGTIPGFSLTFGTATTDSANDGITFTDADVLWLQLNNAIVFIGQGGILQDTDGDNGNSSLTLSDRFSDDTAGTDGDSVGVFGEVGTLELISITAGATKYLGVTASGLGAELIGVDAIVLQAWDAAIQLNSVTPETETKLDWDSVEFTSDSVNFGASAVLDDTIGVNKAVVLHVEGKALVNVLDGVLIAAALGDLDTPGFSLELGKVTTTGSTGSGTPTLDDDDALTLVLNDLQIFVGVGGTFADTTNSAPNNTPDDLSDDEIVAGTFGLRGSLATLNLVSITFDNDTVGITDDDISYLGVHATGVTADLVGLESILELHASQTTIRVNRATDNDADANTTSPNLDWDSITTTSDSITLPALDVDQSNFINATGKLVYNILDGTLAGETDNLPSPGALAGPAPEVQEAGAVGSGSITFGTATIDTGNSTIGVLTDADLIAIELINTDFFVGINGPGLTPDKEHIEDIADDAVGFFVEDVNLKLAIVTPAGLAVGDKTRYMGLEASIGGTELLGVDGLVVNLSGKVLLNQATAANGTPGTERVDWGAAADAVATNGALPDFDETLDSDLQFLVAGEANVDVFGFVTLDGGFAFKKAVADFGITDALTGTTTLLADAEYLTVGAEIENASINAGGIALLLEDLTVAMVMVNSGGVTPVSYTAVKAGIGGASFDGIDGLVLNVVSLSIEVNKSSDALNPNKVLDFADTTGFNADNGKAAPIDVAINTTETETISFDGNEGELLKVAGGLEIDVFGFVSLSGTFAFKKATGQFAITDSTTNTTTLLTGPYLTIGGTVSSAFVGVPGELGTDDDLGFSLTGVEFGLLLFSHVSAPTVKYTALKADITDASFVGVDGLTVGVQSLSIVINRTSDTLNPNAVLDFADTDDFDADDGKAASLAVATGPSSEIEFDFDGNEGDLLQLSGDLSFNLFGFVSLDGTFGIKKATGTFTVLDGSPTGRSFTSSYLLVSATGVNGFAGVNGGTSEAIGFELSEVSFTLALITEASNAANIRSYTALKADVGDGGFVGVPGLDVSVRNLSISINRTSDTLNPNHVVDFNPAGTVAGTPLTPAGGGLAIDFAQEGDLLEVGGELHLELFEVVFVDAEFALQRQSVDVDVNGNGFFSTTEKDLDDATLLTFELTITNLFAGVPGSDLDNPVDGGIGFAVEEGFIALAVIKANGLKIPGDSRSFIAVKASISGATMTGLPGGLDIVAPSLEVTLNTASGTLPGAPAPIAIDWSTSINLTANLTNNAAFPAAPDLVQVGDLEIDFNGAFTTIGGVLTLDAFGVLSASAEFEMVRQTVDVNLPGGTDIDLNDASLLTLELQITDLFIGIPDSVGFSVSSGRLALAMIKANPVTNPGDNRSFMAMFASIRGASLQGLPGITIEAISLDFEQNTASGTAPSIPDPLDWTTMVDLQASDATFDADEIVVGETPVEISGSTMRIAGALKLDIQGFVLAAGSFEISITNSTTTNPLTINDGTTTVTNANLLEVHLSDVFLFAGVNGAFELDDDGNVTGLNTDDAIGFSVSAASLDLAIVSQTASTTPGAPAPKKWMGVAARVGAMTVHGLPSTFEFNVRELELLYNVGSAAPNPTKLDWDQLTQDGVVSGLEGLTADLNLSVSGSLDINISGFVLIAGTFKITKLSNQHIDDGTIIIDGATVLVIELSNVFLFAGIEGAFVRDGDGVVTGLDTTNAIGFSVNNASLDLAIIGEAPSTTPGPRTPPRKWVGVAASIESLQIHGLPEGFEISVSDFSLLYNVASAGPTPTKLNWTDVEQVAGTELENLPSNTELRVSAFLTISISQFVYVSGALAIEKRELQAKTASGAATTMSVLTIGASNVKAFAGVGGPYWVDSDADGDVDNADVPAADGALGLALTIDNFALVMMKPLPGGTSAAPIPSTKSYMALTGSGGAELVGIDGLTLAGQINISMNSAKDSANPTNTPPVPVIDFAASAAINPDSYGSSEGLKVLTGTNTATDFTVIDFSTSFLEVSGSVRLTISEFVHLSGDFAFSKSDEPETVTLSNGTTKQLTVMTIGASNVNAFVGVGGPYFVDSNDDGVIDSNDTPQSDGAMGVVLSDLEFGLALLKPTSLTDKSSYYALKASGGAEIVGVDGLTIRADILGVEVNGGTDPATPTLNDPVVNFATSFGGGLDVLTGPDLDGDGEPSVTLDFTGNTLKAFGAVTIIVDGFVWLSGQFAFEKGGEPVTVTLSNGTTKQVNVLKIGASDVNVFVGTGDPDSNADGMFNGSDDPAANGAIGLKLTELKFGLALMKPVAVTDKSSYFALYAEAKEIALVGVDGVTIGAENLKVKIN
ncbi:MAG TPA: hypothetical protein VK530_08085, partial [Candidatus Acidoferrum sp.]|nr:hypothetical protein [Candidatus Acidoferrum sp.]